MPVKTVGTGTDVGLVRVLVIDDHPVVRTGLSAVIEGEDDLFVVGEAGTAETGLLQVKAGEPDVIVLDVRLGDGMTGIGVCRRVRDEYPDVGVVFLTSYADDVDEAVHAGAQGVVMKRSDTSRLLQAVRHVADGDYFRDPTLDTLTVIHVGEDRPELTSAERRVLEPLARGASNDDIARQLCLSVHTVKSHVRNICEKLGASNRTEAAVIAVRRGLASNNTI